MAEEWLTGDPSELSLETGLDSSGDVGGSPSVSVARLLRSTQRDRRELELRLAELRELIRQTDEVMQGVSEAGDASLSAKYTHLATTRRSLEANARHLQQLILKVGDSEARAQQLVQQTCRPPPLQQPTAEEAVEPEQRERVAVVRGRPSWNAPLQSAFSSLDEQPSDADSEAVRQQLSRLRLLDTELDTLFGAAATADSEEEPLDAQRLHAAAAGSRSAAESLIRARLQGRGLRIPARLLPMRRERACSFSGMTSSPSSGFRVRSESSQDRVPAGDRAAAGEAADQHPTVGMYESLRAQLHEVTAVVQTLSRQSLVWPSHMYHGCGGCLNTAPPPRAPPPPSPSVSELHHQQLMAALTQCLQLLHSQQQQVLDIRRHMQQDRSYVLHQPPTPSAPSVVGHHHHHQLPAALNNQVAPGSRANNYWDNFRSYSRQNLLSNNAELDPSGGGPRAGAEADPAGTVGPEDSRPDGFMARPRTKKQKVNKENQQLERAAGATAAVGAPAHSTSSPADVIYGCVTSLIAQNQDQPEFLTELLHQLQLVRSERQRRLMLRAVQSVLQQPVGAAGGVRHKQPNRAAPPPPSPRSATSPVAPAVPSPVDRHNNNLSELVPTHPLQQLVPVVRNNLTHVATSSSEPGAGKGACRRRPAVDEAAASRVHGQLTLDDVEDKPQVIPEHETSTAAADCALRRADPVLLEDVHGAAAAPFTTTDQDRRTPFLQADQDTAAAFLPADPDTAAAFLPADQDSAAAFLPADQDTAAAFLPADQDAGAGAAGLLACSQDTVGSAFTPTLVDSADSRPNSATPGCTVGSTSSETQFSFD